MKVVAQEVQVNHWNKTGSPLGNLQKAVAEACGRKSAPAGGRDGDPLGDRDEAIGMNRGEGRPEQVAKRALEVRSRKHGERVGLAHHLLDEPRAKDVVLLEIRGGERRAVEPPGRLCLAEHGVRVGSEGEDDWHAEPAKDTGCGEGADVGEPEVRDVEGAVAGDRVRLQNGRVVG